MLQVGESKPRCHFVNPAVLWDSRAGDLIRQARNQQREHLIGSHPDFRRWDFATTDVSWSSLAEEPAGNMEGPVTQIKQFCFFNRDDRESHRWKHSIGAPPPLHVYQVPRNMYQERVEQFANYRPSEKFGGKPQT